MATPLVNPMFPCVQNTNETSYIVVLAVTQLGDRISRANGLYNNPTLQNHLPPAQALTPTQNQGNEMPRQAAMHLEST